MQLSPVGSVRHKIVGGAGVVGAEAESRAIPDAAHPDGRSYGGIESGRSLCRHHVGVLARAQRSDRAAAFLESGPGDSSQFGPSS